MGRKPKKKEDQAPVTDQATPEVKTEVASSETETKKKKAPKTELEQLLSQMESQFGEGCIVTAEEFCEVVKMPTGILLEDILLRGGIPESCIVLKCGEESSGKTLSSLYEAAELTKKGIPVMFVDAEHSFTKEWAIKLGNDPKHFYVAQPADLEKAVDITDIAVRSRKFGMVIFDSLTAAIPKEAVEKSAYEVQVALQARINSKLCQKVTAGLQPENLEDPTTHNKTRVIWIAHLKQKVGVVYGNPDIIPGGKAILFHSHYIMKYSKGAVLKNGDDIIGREIRIKIEKAKYSRPLVSGVTEFFFEPPRINNAKTLIVYSMNLGLIRRVNKEGQEHEKGQFYVYGDVTAKGQAELVQILKERPDLLSKLKQSIIAGAQNVEIKPETEETEPSGTTEKSAKTV
jgi:recombination protein RecA